MADTTFTDGTTLVVSAWLQDINNVYYRLTANRVPYATGTALTSSANLTFNGTTLTAHTLTVSTGALTGVSAAFSTTLAVTGDVTSSAGDFLTSDGRVFGFGAGTTYIQGSSAGNSLSVVINGASRMSFASGAVTIASLAGSGTRTVVVDANGVLSAP